MFGGSLARSIRQSEEQDSGEQSRLPTSRSVAAFHVRRLGALSTQDFGLQDFIVVSAYTYVDYDLDGDLDIITNSVSGPIRVYRNNETQNHSISVELLDYLGDRFGIGSKIVIHYASDEDPENRRHQIREIKSGGGFLSFDPLVAHFGLGKSEGVEQIEIQWPDGKSTTVEGPFAAGARYRIERK